jgi:uncharacterized repeat protein (TIGR03803 family)
MMNLSTAGHIIARLKASRACTPPWATIPGSNLLLAASASWLLLTGAASVLGQTNFTILKFCQLPEGYVPVGALADGRDGALYGLTAGGGVSNLGTIYKLQSDGSHYRTLKNFLGADGAGPAYGGLLLGTNGALFGVTYFGGISNSGTVFSINKDGSGFQVLHSFTGGSDGKNPAGDLIQGMDGAIYGTTYAGDAATRGTIFKINQDGTGYMILHAFTGNPDGQQPRGRLLQTSDGWLYGTTAFGGAASVPGTIYMLSPYGGTYGVIHVFGSAGDGRQPAAGLSLGKDGALYGTAAYGGTDGVGMVFKMDAWGLNYTALRSFSGSGGDGQHPDTELVEGSDGAWYGTTSQGGLGSFGTVFKLAKDGTGYAILHNYGMTPDDFQSPYGDLLPGSNGVFYGTAMYGGGEGAGCISVLSPSPLAPRMVSLSVNPASNSIVCQATAGIQYALERSTDFSSWSVLTNAPAPPNCRLSFIDVNPPPHTAFYRLEQH